MDKNHHDKAESKGTTTENKLWYPPLSPKDQEKLDHLRNEPQKARRNRKVVLYSIVFVEVILLIFTFLLIFTWFLHNYQLWLLILLILIGILLLIMIIQAIFREQWTGFSGKTLWDWLQLLGVLAIPIAVTGATILFGIQQANLAQLQHENDQKIANQQHEADKQSALDQQQATILQTYIDNIQDLLLNHNLLKSKPTDDVALLAQARTLTALQGLDSVRKGLLVKFIYEAKLIGFLDSVGKPHSPVINLTDANLTSVDFSEIKLLSEPTPTTCTEGTCTIYNTPINFYISQFSGVHFSNADLTDANFLDVNFTDADLTDASFIDADLNLAILTDANLTGAILTGADFPYATLTDANLTGATLDNADLTDAINLTQQQLDQVSSCTGAILPKGLTCHHNQ